ncbi:glycoside hydrolase family 16 protein [Kutzneria sp. CA-103260]|uniref:glycoside hydrolase family 16 protein n=1 Tax=Kutzneria sp. CA-103260 TaxID=2802641 RepID=UPI001BAD8D61|nr:glycoside hydrolase family 16 protein [Kutzneria sp. CA-103260]QUQ63155.1 glycosyl hydrolase family protein [Kutzneria sp. CA-103260]
MTSLARSRRIAVAVAAMLLTGLATATTGHAAPAVTAGFTDDFNGPAGSPADGSKWNYQTGDNVNNHERQWYTDGNRNAALDGQGHLVITAKKEGGHNCWYGPCQYTSARLTTFDKFSPQYGHIEVRMQIPRGQGMWPAFWMLGTNINNTPWPNCGEIDIMENVGKEPNAVHGSIHGPGYSGAQGLNAPFNGPVFADGFHTYAVHWAKDSIKFSVDGKVYVTRTPQDVSGKQWVFNHPFYLILNLAIGGDWPGDPDGGTQFPAKLVVDYVHAS